MKKESVLKNSSLIRKTLQILRMRRELVGCQSTEEESDHLDILANHGYMKETETAFIEAERKKAEALMEWHKHSSIR